MTTSTPSVAIVGGGQAGVQAATSLREQGYPGAISIFCAEAYLPYQRPPLSKTFLKEDSPPEKVYLRPDKYFADQSITVRTNTRVAAIDRAQQTLTLDNGETIGWTNLVLATGVVNRRLPAPGADLDGVVMLRGIDDALAIRPRLKAASRIVVIGGGVIGLEVAAMSRGLGLEVDLIELGDRLCGRIASTALTDRFLAFHRGLGSRVHLSSGVDRIDGVDGKVTGVVLSNGQRLETSLVLVCIGVLPDTALAEACGVEVRDGIVVDDNARTSDPNIFAAGDCTRFKPAHGMLDSIRLESVQNAIDQAKCAASAILGKPYRYDSLPWFWSDQGSLKLQIAGLTTGHDRVVVKEGPAAGAAAIYCFANGELLGVECINRPADFMAARRVLGAGKHIRIEDVERPDFEMKAYMS